MITLYRRNRIGIGTWRVWADGSTVRISHASVIGGQEVEHEEVVPAGLAGRTLEEQVTSRINSRINRQLDRGYVRTLEEARDRPLTNTLDLPPPMLAKKITDVKAWPGRCIGQPKFDGHRCLVTRSADGEVIAYSRQGKLITVIEHVTDAFEETLDAGAILDGELYLHGRSLQEIASLAKRRQPDTSKLCYHVYDSISDRPFADRYGIASIELGAIRADERISLVPNAELATLEDAWEFFRECRASGYEGAMARRLDMPYESGCRSSGLLKLKDREDAEFTVTDVLPGSDGCGVLVCTLPNGRYFRTLAPGSHDEKRRTVAQKHLYIGRRVRVEYANLTKDGIPFHCVATGWYDDI